MDSLNNGPRYGGDAWLELQAFKTRQINRREKLNRHKDLINGIATSHNNNSQPSTITAGTAASLSTTSSLSSTQHAVKEGPPGESDQRVNNLALEPYDSPPGNSKCCQSEQTSEKALLAANSIEDRKGNNNNNESQPQNYTHDIDTVECLLLLRLCDIALKLPIDSKSLLRSICKIRGLEHTAQSTVENLLEKFAHQELITIEEPTSSIIGRNASNKHKEQDDEVCVYVISADHTKLVEFNRAFGSSDTIRALMLDETGLGDLTTSEHNHSAQSQGSTSTSGCPAYIHHDEAHRKTSYKLSVSEKIKRRLAMGEDVESLLSLSSTREKESKKLGEELLELLSKPTAKERNLLESFRSADGYQVQEFCPKGTKDECRRNIRGLQACEKLHFKKIIAKHTEESLGDCSFLNTCFHMDSCKYVHYEVDYDDKQQQRQQQQQQLGKPNSRRKKAQARLEAATCPTPKRNEVQDKASSGGEQVNNNNNNNNNNTSVVSAKADDTKQIAIYSATEQVLSTKPTLKYALSPEEQARIEIRNRKRFKTVLYPPQWIQCDLRYFDMSLLGKFSVVMADPPWDIHMNLPYGTMSDDEMRKLNVPALQDEGVIFLWVTGRAMELGRECLALWGYERADEILWVKTNQLQRIIRTGRTGHWLNHGKEHCLVGVKGNPTEMNRGLDCDVIVAEVRATSHKPDEIYGIIERLSPGTRKIELFGRAHNVQPNWITLGNQLDGVRLVEPSLIESFKKLNLPYETTDHVE